MPHTKISYKYILTVIDTASRFKAAEPLKNKTAAAVCRENLFNNKIKISRTS